jgi:hypothetical protein
VQQVSIETAQSKLDCSVLEKLPGKTIILGVLDLSDMRTWRYRRGAPRSSHRPPDRDTPFWVGCGALDGCGGQLL